MSVLMRKVRQIEAFRHYIFYVSIKLWKFETLENMMISFKVEEKRSVKRY